MTRFTWERKKKVKFFSLWNMNIDKHSNVTLRKDKGETPKSLWALKI